MKKLLSIVLVLCLLPVVAFCEDVSDLEDFLESCTFEELLNLNRVVQLYLVKKSVTGGDGVVMEPGTYEVGVDIPAGNCYFEGVKGRFPSSIHVYPSWDKMGTFDETQYVNNIGYGGSAQSPKSGKFALFYGNIIQIIQGPAVLHAFTGLFN